MVWGGGGGGRVEYNQRCHCQAYWGHSANPGDDTSGSNVKGVHLRLDYEGKYFFKYPVVEFAVRYGLKIIKAVKELNQV